MAFNGLLQVRGQGYAAEHCGSANHNVVLKEGDFCAFRRSFFCRALRLAAARTCGSHPAMSSVRCLWKDTMLPSIRVCLQRYVFKLQKQNVSRIISLPLQKLYSCRKCEQKQNEAISCTAEEEQCAFLGNPGFGSLARSLSINQTRHVIGRAGDNKLSQ